jgi:RNA polymerase sigma-70 factor (ECF subfamily)
MIDWPQIVSAHSATLWRAVYRVLNHRDDALDCCQDALLDAYRYAQNHDVDDWGALLTSLGTCRAIDRLRQRIRSRQVVISLKDTAEPATDADCPVQRAEASELVDRLRSVVAELPDKQSHVFWLSCVEGLSHEQIGRQLTISPNESRVLLHRARLRLASMLDSHHCDARRTL